MTTLYCCCCLPSLSPTGWCSIIDLLGPCVSRTSRSSTPVNVWTATGFFTDEWDDTVQSLVSWGTSVKSYDVAKQCNPPLIDDLIDAWKTSCGSSICVLYVIIPLRSKYLSLTCVGIERCEYLYESLLDAFAQCSELSFRVEFRAYFFHLMTDQSRLSL